MYDVSNRESFEALDSWLEEIKRDIGSQADFEGVAFAVCANKVRHLKNEIPLLEELIFFHPFFYLKVSKCFKRK